MELDDKDEDVRNAITKIQAGFRGHKARQEMRSQQQAPDDKTNTTQVAFRQQMRDISAARAWKCHSVDFYNI